jgi:hypothetical protein
MHPFWTDYFAAGVALCQQPRDLIVPIGETLPDLPIIPAECFHGKCWTSGRGDFESRHVGL